MTLAQDTATIPVGSNLVTESIPALPASLVSDVKTYTESRSASIAAWHPLRKEMIVATRFSNATQLHYVKMPGGDRSRARSIQVHGGLGLMKELPLEWWYRQIRSTRITEGANEVLRWRLGQNIIRKHV